MAKLEAEARKVASYFSEKTVQDCSYNKRTQDKPKFAIGVTAYRGILAGGTSAFNEAKPKSPQDLYISFRNNVNPDQEHTFTYGRRVENKRIQTRSQISLF
jgi:hypothetical protein